MNERVYSKDINFKNILFYVIPTMIMVLVQASYSMIDGIFISNIIRRQCFICSYINFATI